MRPYLRRWTTGLYALSCIAFLLYSGCVRPETLTEKEAPTAKGDTGHYAYITLLFPRSIGGYTQYMHNAIPANTNYDLSNIFIHSNKKSGFYIRLFLEEAHRAYSFIEYDATASPPATTIFINAAHLVELLQIPPQFLPSPAFRLSEAEIVEFYRWQFANAVPSDQIGSLLNDIEITLSFTRNSEEKSAPRASASLVQMLRATHTLTIRR